MDLIVSVLIITYNHEKFIAKSIESVLNQETDFNFEILIGEDCSTDGTKILINKYLDKYPDKIRLISSEVNVGAINNEIRLLKSSKGKYITIIEGDDYWTDSKKLQKQVDFLERNPQYSLCSHSFSIIDSLSGNISKINYSNALIEASNGIEIDMNIFLKDYLTKTFTVVFRRDLLNFEKITQYKYYRDVHLFFHLIKQKNGFFMNFDWGTYRKHDGGIYSSLDKLEKMKVGYQVYFELYINNKDTIGLKQKFTNSFLSYIDESIRQESVSKQKLIYLTLKYFYYTQSIKKTLSILKFYQQINFKIAI